MRSYFSRFGVSRYWTGVVTGLAAATGVAALVGVALDAPGPGISWFADHQWTTSMLADAVVLLATYLIIDRVADARQSRKWRLAAIPVLSETVNRVYTILDRGMPVVERWAGDEDASRSGSARPAVEGRERELILDRVRATLQQLDRARLLAVATPDLVVLLPWIDGLASEVGRIEMHVDRPALIGTLTSTYGTVLEAERHFARAVDSPLPLRRGIVREKVDAAYPGFREEVKRRRLAAGVSHDENDG